MCASQMLVCCWCLGGVGFGPCNIIVGWGHESLSALHPHTPTHQVLATRDELECESRLVVLLDVDKFDFIKRLLRNRGKVLYCTRLKQAQTDAEKKAVEAEMLQDVELGGPAILEALYQKVGGFVGGG